MTNANKKGAGAPADQTIWRWKNTARLTTNFMEVGFAVAAVVIAGTAIYAAAKGVALSSLLPTFLVNPWVITAIASYVAVYFAARCISAWQETYAVGKTQSTLGKSVILDKCVFDDVIGKGTLLLEEVEANGTQSTKLSLQLSDDARKVLIGKSKEGILYLVGKKYENIALKYKVEDNGIAVQLTVNNLTSSDLTKIRKELGMEEGANSLDLVLSNLSHVESKEKVLTELANVAVEKVLNATEKQQGNPK